MPQLETFQPDSMGAPSGEADKAVNPNATIDEDLRPPRELVEFVEMKNQEGQDIPTRLKVML